MEVAIRGPATGDDREQVVRFLRAEGYTQPIQDDDQVYAAWMSSNVVGALRLAAEEGVTVLRGMRVRSDLRRRGIGRRLLRHIDEVLGPASCYCLPYPWLTDFYSRVGFELVQDKEAPSFLVERRAKYAEWGIDVVIMLRPHRSERR